MGSNTLNLTLSDALWNPLYRQATWVNIIYMFFHEVAGINVIYQYSSQIYIDMKAKNPRLGTIILGIDAIVFGFTSIIVIRKLKRKTIFIGGHIGVGISWLLVAYFNYVGNSLGIIIGMNMFMLFYINSSGPLAWTYAAETCVDAAIGIVIMCIYVNVIYLAIICPIILAYNPNYVFIGMSLLSFVGAVFCWIYMKETKGLTDKEKKEIYRKKI